MSDERREQLVRAIGELDDLYPRDLDPIAELQPTAKELAFLAAWAEAPSTKLGLAAMRQYAEDGD